MAQKNKKIRNIIHTIVNLIIIGYCILIPGLSGYGLYYLCNQESLFSGFLFSAVTSIFLILLVHDYLENGKQKTN